MSRASGRRIVIAAGGTAGHVVPALAVADALRRRGADVSFVGGSRAEATLVPQAGFPLHTLALEGMSRSNPLLAMRALLRAAAAVPQAARLLRRLHADAVLGGGGYVSGPIGLAALLSRVPLVLTEADSHLGLANRLLTRGARRVCLAFPLTDEEGVPLSERDGRYRVTGRPIFPVRPGRRDAARERFGLRLQTPCVLVFGGSLGARSINDAAMKGLRGLPPLAQVLHVCGRRDHPALAGRELKEGYVLIDYLNVADFGDALAAADLAIGRAGGSVFEIAAHGLPAILIPYPHAAGDHQSGNAAWMVDAGAAIAIPDGELNASRLRREVRDLLADEGRLAAMAAASNGLARPHAAAEIADELLQAAAR